MAMIGHFACGRQGQMSQVKKYFVDDRKRYTEPEGRIFFSAHNAALEGPLFHGIIEVM